MCGGGGVDGAVRKGEGGGSIYIYLSLNTTPPHTQKRNSYPLKTPRADRKHFKAPPPPPPLTPTDAGAVAGAGAGGDGVFDPSPLPEREMRPIDFKDKVWWLVGCHNGWMDWLGRVLCSNRLPPSHQFIS